MEHESTLEVKAAECVSFFISLLVAHRLMTDELYTSGTQASKIKLTPIGIHHENWVSK